MSSKQFVPLWIAIVVVMAGYGIFIPIIAYVSNSGKVAINLASLILSAFALGQLISSPIMGHLADRIGSKNTLLIGLIGYTSSLVLTLIASNLLIILLFRLTSGLFAGAGVSSVEIYISKMSNKQLKAKYFTLTSIAIGVGMTVGPLLGIVYLFIPIKIAAVLAISFIMIAIIILKLVQDDADIDLSKSKVEEPFKVRLTNALKQRQNQFSLITCWVFGLITSSLEAIGLLYLINNVKPSKLLLLGVVCGSLLTFGYVIFISPYLINHLHNLKLAIGLYIIIAVGLIMIAVNNLQSVMISGIFIMLLAMSTLITTITVIVTKSNSKPGMMLGLRNSTLNIGSIIGPIIASSLYLMNPRYPFVFLAIISILGAVYGYRGLNRSEHE